MLCWRCGRRLALAFTAPRRRALAGTAAVATWPRGWTASTRVPRRPFSSDGGDTKTGGDRDDGLTDRPPRPSSIFDELFPDGARKKPAQVDAADERDARLRAREAEDDDGLGSAEVDTAAPDTTPTPHPSPADDPSAVPEEIRHWLDDATEEGPARSARENNRGQKGTATTKQPPTVLVLSGTTASLLPSDFFRIAPRAHASQGHRRSSSGIDGWAAARGGLYKVVQDRDPATLAPRGRYFLYFGSAAGALAYAQEARDLHVLARRALGLDSVSVGVGSGGMGARRGTADDAAAAALRSFTLVAPSARLDLVMEVPAAKAQEAESTPGGSSLRFLPDDVPAATTKVLLVLMGHGPDSSPTPSDGTTVDGVRRLLAADGVARNVPWGVSEGLNGVVPVPWVVAERQRRQEERRRQRQHYDDYSSGADSRLPDLVAKTDQMNEHARYTRFVVAFADAVEARRFVRSWHRRPVTLAWQRQGREEGEAGGPGGGPADGPAAETEAGLSAVLEATVLW